MLRYAFGMPDYRRYFVAGATYFFTLKTEWNEPLFNHPANVTLLGNTLREMCVRWPVTIDAIVLLPDHLHAIWSLPSGDVDYSKRWGWTKKEFSIRYLATGGQEQQRSDSRIRNRRRGIWQRRFWEHMIRDEADFDAHFDYIHWNPVKHEYVARPADWLHSSFHRWVKAGVYSANWGCGVLPPPSIRNVLDAGE
jgi:putative transposase